MPASAGAAHDAPESPLAAVARRARNGLLAVAAFLALASLAGQWARFVLGHDRVFGLVRLFDIGREGNVPAWFSSTLLLVSALLLWSVAAVERRRGNAHAVRWVVLGAVTMLLSVDETASVHERLRLQYFGIGDGGSFLTRSWTVPVGIAALVAGAFCIPFLRALPDVTRLRFTVAAGVFFLGAVGLEVVSALYAMEHGQLNFSFALISTVEEFLEMTGVILFIRALLLHLDLMKVWPAPAAPPAPGG